MKFGVIAFAVLAFSSFIWGAYFFFKASNAGSRNGRRIISAAVGAFMLVSLANILFDKSIEELSGFVSMLLFGASTAIFWLCVRAARGVTFNFLGSDQAPRMVVRKGLYRRIRHPFYLSYILGWIASLVASPNIVSIAILSIMSLIYYKSAKSEERSILASPNSAEYAEYMKKSGMFLPKLIKSI